MWTTPFNFSLMVKSTVQSLMVKNDYHKLVFSLRYESTLKISLPSNPNLSQKTSLKSSPIASWPQEKNCHPQRCHVKEQGHQFHWARSPRQPSISHMLPETLVLLAFKGSRQSLSSPSQFSSFRFSSAWKNRWMNNKPSQIVIGRSGSLQR